MMGELRYVQMVQLRAVSKGCYNVTGMRREQ